MNKDDSKKLSGKLDLYTLDEASEKTGYGIPSILMMAADGHISLHTTIPIGWEIFSIDTADLPPCQYKKTNGLIFSFRENNSADFEKADPAIELLRLSIEDCKNIKDFDHTKQGAFTTGLKTTYNQPPTPAIPTKKKSTYKIGHSNTSIISSLSRCFVILKKPTSTEEILKWNINHSPYQETIINKDRIRILHTELEKIHKHPTHKPEKPEALNSKKSSVTIQKHELKNISRRLYTPGRAHTKLLEALYRVAKHACETYRSTGKYPSNSEIEENIKKICPECSKSLAQKSATIIKAPPQDRNELSDIFLTNYFWALIDTSEMHYHQSPPKEKDEKQNVLQWLEEDLNFEASLALAGSRIIDPHFKANTI